MILSDLLAFRPPDFIPIFGFFKSNPVNFPLTLTVGSVSLPLHALFEIAAFFIGFRYFIYLRRRQGDRFSTGSRVCIITGAIFGALIGSRLIGSLERPYELLATDHLFLYIYANKTVLGGLLGGLAGVELVKKMAGETRASGDLFVYPIILALIIGRIGCFSMGVHEQTYGTATTMPWGMYLGDGIQRHPVTVYEIFFLLLLWITLYRTGNRLPLKNGALFKLFMIAYVLFRFFLDFIKPAFPVLMGLSVIQLASLAGLAYYARYIFAPVKLVNRESRMVN